MEKKHRAIWLLFDRILAQDIFRQAVILIVILAAVLIASFVLLSLSGADWITYCNENNISKWVFPLYLLIDGNAFNSFYVSDKVSGGTVFVAGVIYVIGVIIFTGMLISVMTNMIERRVEDHKEGHIHYLESGHYVIMGFDEMVPSFIRYVFEKDSKAFVLILTSVEAERVKEKLNKTFSQEQLKQVIINYGHRTNPESYKNICLESAEEVFIVGYHSQTAHDAINVECVDAICDYLSAGDIKSKPSRITCVFKDLDTYAAFKTTEIFGEVSKLGIEFIPYNFYTGWAKQVFVKRGHKELSSSGQEVEYPAVYGEGIGPDDKKYVHLVFVGTTNFAVAFAMEAANVLHFPNFNQDKSLKTRITFIDLNADKEKDEFITRNRHFFEVQDYIYRDLSDPLRPMAYKMPATYFREKASNFLDVEFEFIKGDIFSKRVQDEISRWANATDEQYLSIFLAMANQRNNFVLGMNMPDEVYDNEIPVFIRQDRSDNFVTNLREADVNKRPYTRIVVGKKHEESRLSRYSHIYPFGMNESIYCADDKSLKRAKLINYLYNTADYSTNKFQSLLVLAATPKKQIWEEADKMWKGDPDNNQEGLSVSLKWSNLYSSYSIRTKLASLRAMRGLTLENKSKDTQKLTEKEVEELAKVEHNRWNVEKLLMGYRKPHHDEDKYEASGTDAKSLSRNKKVFIHHDIRPFEDLDNVKELDYEFTRYIPWIMEMTEP